MLSQRLTLYKLNKDARAPFSSQAIAVVLQWRTDTPMPGDVVLVDRAAAQGIAWQKALGSLTDQDGKPALL